MAKTNATDAAADLKAEAQAQPAAQESSPVLAEGESAPPIVEVETPAAKQAPTPPAVKAKTAAQLKAIYDSKLAAVQQCLKNQKKYEIQLENDKKEKLKAKAGDLQDLMKQKLAAHAEWQAAARVEGDAAERSKSLAQK